MTETLAEKECAPCRGGIAPLTHEQAERFQSQIPNWELRDDSHRVERSFRFRNFQEPLGLGVTPAQRVKAIEADAAFHRAMPESPQAWPRYRHPGPEDLLS
jgi:Pterin 4 alpha carbinolamine dehydratase